ncbi:E3 ubiquitin-protein ligase UHRF1-like [Macrosteles quadrilineatus]|uniref:E3 ubiquitin-protein ligase UHRF1-like n=1 Tax=Macrosteles quadrilineatus TaxID=74068 RepID=UPI0023E32921|nr:E3 ubiquitin-protein ligase UHRF1-like [Macrosteles quadrilineatus]
MYIQVRTVDAKTKITVDISKVAPVSELKKQLESHFGIKPENQRLFFRGKQLENGYSLFDYNINVNDMVQIMEKVTVEEASASTKSDKENAATDPEPSTSSSNTAEKEPEECVERSIYFKVGEYVDTRDETYGAWFEGKISRIIKDNNYEENKIKFSSDEATGYPHDGYFYEVEFLAEGEPVETSVFRLKDVRPRAREEAPFKECKVGQKVLANYNVEEPHRRGFWYESIITFMTQTKWKHDNVMHATVLVGDVPMSDCKLQYPNELLKIAETKPLAEREPIPEEEPPIRETEIPHDCKHCNNNPRRNCKECGCCVCGLKTDESKQILCDECDSAYHIWCLKPPLEAIPDTNEWYCSNCKNDENEIVGAGGKLKESKKKAKMASKQNNTTRDWGKGMACVGRTKVCTIVPHDHFGPVPGIEVGTCWKFRIQASEAGVHRPHVAGIHGRENIGAFSVVLSGGYEDDIDNGDEFLYTGSGGRDLTGNKRTNAQGFDQTLTRFNKAIAMNCNVPLSEKGGEAKDWRGGKPIRVLRNYKLAKHSKYAPEDGNRYDGIYKVVKYYPEKGKSGFNVWRYLFRRDDPAPAPWTKEGKKRIESLGLEMEYPEGYLEALATNQKKEDADESETPKSKGKGKKRVLEESTNTQPKANVKKAKVLKYELEKNVACAIEKDTGNNKLWEDCKTALDSGKPKFLSKVEETFTCICCTELVYKPVTTDCSHNFCLDCLKRSFNADVQTCPTCRNPLEKQILNNVNSSLQDVLDILFPGYTKSR